MSDRRRTEWRLNHALVLVGALFAAAAVWPWLSQDAVSHRLPEMPPAPGAASLPVLPPLGRFGAIFERPLFSPSRRPAAGSGATAAAAGIVGHYRLLGVIRVGMLRRALLAKGTRILEIGEGGSIEGWRVGRIGQDRLVLSSAAGTAMLIVNPAAESGAPGEAIARPAGVAVLSPGLPSQEAPVRDGLGRARLQ